MTTQTLPVDTSRSSSEVPRKIPFLDALEHIHYGKITIATPEGKILKYAGPEAGYDAYLRLYDWDVLDELLAHGETGFAHAYIDERWESPDVAELIAFALQNSAFLEKFFYGKPLYAIWMRMRHFIQSNTRSGSRRNIMAHYDLGNEFYALWLDKSMTYSGGLFEGSQTRTLEEAQQAKYQRILRKLNASKGDHILEIGCGWGGFAEAAARQGLRVTAITLSGPQAEYARERLSLQGLESNAVIDFCDYREIKGMFDHVVSIGMFEHVGERYWPTYFKAVANHLRPGGKAVIQSITLDDYLFESLHGKTGFIEQYIFPGGMLPSKSRFLSNATKAGLTCKEMYSFGADYAITLRHWLERFNAQEKTVRNMGYGTDFIRLWRFYLASCIASFRCGRTDVMQAFLTK